MSKTLEISPNALISKKVLDRYLALELPANKVMATYIWLDGPALDICSKDRALDFVPKSVNELPIWAAGHGEADGTFSEWYLHPVKIYRDPFRQGNHILVLCETYSGDGKPSVKNRRNKCAEIAAKCAAEEPWFGIEQEYVFLDFDGHPLGWPKNGCPGRQGVENYCGVGAKKVYGRDVVEAHTRACLYAGIKLAGTNAEGMPAQWEFQIGPCPDVTVADDLWVARFLLHRIAEDFGIVVTFDPKPMEGEWFGSGAHCNVSTKSTRAKGGITAIHTAIDKLSKRHDKHIKAYDPKGGKDNERRLVAGCATSSIHDFSAGVSNRSASIRIPKTVADNGCGYFEDRRPSSNCDPYAVVSVILSTICLNE
ncbi:glutamine synthetase 2 cytoplasmic-like [Sitodiplosis mosellana]|uniref:glutamine synthetase 2 cytoplasmic-like n=1 Tax=Sitodiplosis mosellana TaxID=263140 RepID=UPI002444DD58|nr:glutamine synthetase 2 cytoplasmic-like [Sitodiplosis mosellana]